MKTLWDISCSIIQTKDNLAWNLDFKSFYPNLKDTDSWMVMFYILNKLEVVRSALLISWKSVDQHHLKKNLEWASKARAGLAGHIHLACKLDHVRLLFCDFIESGNFDISSKSAVGSAHFPSFALSKLSASLGTVIASCLLRFDIVHEAAHDAIFILTAGIPGSESIWNTKLEFRRDISKWQIYGKLLPALKLAFARVVISMAIFMSARDSHFRKHFIELVSNQDDDTELKEKILVLVRNNKMKREGGSRLWCFDHQAHWGVRVWLSDRNGLGQDSSLKQRVKWLEKMWFLISQAGYLITAGYQDISMDAQFIRTIMFRLFCAHNLTMYCKWTR